MSQLKKEKENVNRDKKISGGIFVTREVPMVGECQNVLVTEDSASRSIPEARCPPRSGKPLQVPARRRRARRTGE